LILVVAIAALVAARSRSGAPSYGTTLMALVLAAVPSFLVFLQPDLGTALVLMGTVLIMLTVAGAPPVLLLGLVGGVFLAAPHYMHDYQRARMLVYLHPEADPSGIGYNLIQARIATGAGGQWGTGLYLGSMTQSGFVPENHTDFIFSAMGEELGFVGCVGFLALCTILVSRVVRTALHARERFDMLLAAGVAALLSLHAIINVAMVIGMLPATGVPLPFVSYGGTAVITQMATLGLVLGMARKQGKVAAPVDDRWEAEPVG
jgi:rod shape determining protein RodA